LCLFFFFQIFFSFLFEVLLRIYFSVTGQSREKFKEMGGKKKKREKGYNLIEVLG
jgi:hypothetical protein